MNRYKNYEAGRLSSNISRPESKSSQYQEFGGHFPSDKSSTTVMEHGEKSYNASVAESQEAINLDHGMLTYQPTSKWSRLRYCSPADMYAQIASLVDINCGTRCSPNSKRDNKTQNQEEDSADVEVAIRSLSDLVSTQEQARRNELETIKSMFLVAGAPKVSKSSRLYPIRLYQCICFWDACAFEATQRSVNYFSLLILIRVCLGTQYPF